jgi:hypothetical protein
LRARQDHWQDITASSGGLGLGRCIHKASKENTAIPAPMPLWLACNQAVPVLTFQGPVALSPTLALPAPGPATRLVAPRGLAAWAAKAGPH